MDQSSFEQDLRRDGFAEIGVKAPGPGQVNAGHAHDFDLRALVLSGEITVVDGDVAATCRTGEVFTMAAGRPHEERVGAGGVSYLVGRRRR